MSFNHVNMISQQFKFSGLQNYIDIFKDKVAITALKNTALFSLIVVPIQTIIALLIAYALSSQGIKGKKII